MTVGTKNWPRTARFWTFYGLILGLAGGLTISSFSQANDSPVSESWDLESANQNSLSVEPVREDAFTQDGLKLGIKHFARPGAQPVLLIHGLAQNDRGWDPAMKKYSFARYLHAQGFDVWVGNMRGVGTAGFRSDAPSGPHHWSVDDFAIYDIPALVEAVRKGTGQAPFVVGHSLAAWALEGYLAGLSYDERGGVASRRFVGQSRQSRIRGIATIAGVYSLRWSHRLGNFATDPVRCVTDYYQSNYELELLAGIKFLYRVIPQLPTLPMGWIGRVIQFPVDQIPWIGGELRKLYQGFQTAVIETPILSMFYFSPNVDPALVSAHGVDGLEDLGPHLIEQLGNALNDGHTSSYYHLDRPQNAYTYGAVRDYVDLPMLFIGGGRDRLASDLEIYEDGYLATRARDKQYLHVEEFGHMDVLTGVHAPQEVMAPVAKWIRERM